MGFFFSFSGGLVSGKRGGKGASSRIPTSAQSNLTQGSRLSLHTSQCLYINPINMDELLPELQVCVLFLHIDQAPVGVPH